MPTYSIILGIDRIVNFVSFNLKIKSWCMQGFAFIKTLNIQEV